MPKKATVQTIDRKRVSVGRVSATQQNPIVRRKPTSINAKYDAAQTTPDNSRHWAAADAFSSLASNTAAVRLILRKRSRYEYLNNTYCKSMVRILADDLIGTTPHLQIKTDDKALNSRIERDFMRWMNASNMAEKLRQMKRSQVVDGESFGILATNPRLTTPIKLDMMVIEADRVAEPTGTDIQSPYQDGIRYDSFGNPTSYTVLKTHPGDFYFNSMDYTTVSADFVLHWYDSDRAEQQRGIPAITPALPLFAQLRRYTLAVLAAAETAADFSVFLKTQGIPDEEGAEACDAMETMEIVKRMMTTLPAGWDISQLKAEQPTTTYGDFKKELLNEIARTLNLPFNVAIGNSSGYNYASGRLDHQTYFKNVRISQHKLCNEVLDRIFNMWVQEALMLPEYRALRGIEFDHTWIFDGWEHVDPQKEATAQKTRLGNLTTTLAAEYAKTGKDWESELEQIAKERAKMKELGISVEVPNKNDTPVVDDTEDDTEDDIIDE